MKKTPKIRHYITNFGFVLIFPGTDNLHLEAYGLKNGSWQDGVVKGDYELFHAFFYEKPCQRKVMLADAEATAAAHDFQNPADFYPDWYDPEEDRD